ncbi:RNA-directed DNA polymerase [Candidatus Saccharibacteria bacterium]|nr:RNA-directed DNA polymerase [Candidatus Saccharibacteria bacterium]
MPGGLKYKPKPKGERPEDIDATMQPGEIRDWLHEQFFKAYTEARCGKRGTTDEHRFEINALEDIVGLVDDVMARRYKPSRGIAFVAVKPVIREIFAAPFRDRIIHHFLFNMVAEWWDKRFIYDSYSCRKGKGTLFGVQRVAKHMQAVTKNYTEEAVIVKLDIQSYFMNLERKKLYERVVWGLDRQFPEKGPIYEVCKYLWREVIFDVPTEGVRRRGNKRLWSKLYSKSLFNQPPGKGIVIGNLSSQLLSNIYLDQLDRFVTKELGYKHYGRYVDDFFIMVPKSEQEQALRDVRLIDDYLASLGLPLHPRKRYIQPVRHGVPFLGVVIYPGHIVPGKRVVRNFKLAMQLCTSGRRINLESVISYMGHLKHINSKKLLKRVFEKFGMEYKF